MISSRSKKIYVRVSEFYKKRYKVFLLLKDKTYVRATNKTVVFKKNRHEYRRRMFYFFR